MANTDDSPPSPYKGRKPRRANSRHRRKEILQATLRIIAEHGIRAVRHRAIAKEADVPLSATTYYFKDIDDLISDAFSLFAEQSQQRNAWLQEQTRAHHQRLQNELQTEPGSQALRQSLGEILPQLLLEHIRRQVQDTQARRLEHAFLNETLHSGVLSQGYKSLRQGILEAMMGFLEQLGNPTPEADAHTLFGLIQWLEYLLVVEDNPSNWQLAEQSLKQQLRYILR